MPHQISQKFKSLVHYFIAECPNPELLGSIRLNKALWFSDVQSYKSTGASISGETYIKKERGPVPKFIRECLDELKSQGAIKVAETKYFFGPRIFQSLKAPDTRCLSADEKRVAKAVLDHLVGTSATDVSEMSHDMVWQVAELDEEIPMFATLGALRGEVTPEVVAWANAQ